MTVAATIPAKATKPANSLRQVFDRRDGTFKIAKSSDTFTIDPFVCEIEEGFNPRDYEREDVEAHIEYLTQCYIAGRDMGEWKVIVRDGKILVRDGHCRRLAVGRAKERGVIIQSVRVVECAGDEISQIFEILGTNNGLKLNPVERASTYQRLVNQGVTLEEIASREKMTVVAVKQCLAVEKLPVELKKLIANNTVVMTLALELYNDYGTEAVEKVKAAIAFKTAQLEEEAAAMRAKAEAKGGGSCDNTIDLFVSQLETSDTQAEAPTEVEAGDVDGTSTVETIVAESAAPAGGTATATLPVTEAPAAAITGKGTAAPATVVEKKQGEAGKSAEKPNKKPATPKVNITKKDLVKSNQIPKDEKLSGDEVRNIKSIFAKLADKLEENLHLESGNGIDINLDAETVESIIKLAAKLK